MLLLQLLAVIHFAAACAAQENVTEGSSSASFLPTTTAPTTYVPPVPHLNSASSLLDVFSTEKVQLTCEIVDAAKWILKWFHDGNTISEADPNLTLSSERSVLTITAGANYSGVYSCQGVHKTKPNAETQRSNTAKVTVHEIPLPSLRNVSPWLDVFPGESVKLSCGIGDSSDWTYVWYKDEREIDSRAVSFDASGAALSISSAAAAHKGQYKCSGRLKDRSVSSGLSSGLTLTVYDETPAAILTRDPDYELMFPSESVRFTCHMNVSSGWVFDWYKHDSPLSESSNTVLLARLEASDDGSYKCRANRGKTPTFFTAFSQEMDLNVEVNKPKPSVTQMPDAKNLYAGETVTFECEVKGSGWEYDWFKDGHLVLGHSSRFVIPNATKTESGTYHCVATRNKTNYITESEKRTLNVAEIPVPHLRIVTEWLDVFPGESVKLSCGIGDSSDWTYVWYKDEREIDSRAVSFDASGAALSISSAAAAHKGQYKCSGRLKDRSVSSGLSSGLMLTVYDETPAAILTRDPDYELMFPSEFVRFTCHMNVSSGWVFDWYKHDSPLSESSNTVLLARLEASDDGSYKCRAKRGTTPTFFTAFSQEMDLNVEVNKPKPSVTQMPDAKNLYAGETVTFECEVKGSGWEYDWFKDGHLVLGHSSRFVIPNATKTESGTYHCVATRNKTNYITESEKRTLNIAEIPVPHLKQTTPWLEVFPDETVSLGCRMSERTSDWTYAWYRDGKEIQPDPDLSFEDDNTALTIDSASSEHKGRYSCMGRLKARPVSSRFSSELALQVYDAPPSVTLTQTPKRGTLMHTGDELLFSCHVSVSSEWKYMWYKDDQPVSELGPNYTIKSVWTTHAGQYKCQVKRGVDFKADSLAVKLEVEERPQAEISLLTGWAEAFSTDTLVLQCKVENTKYAWNYTWFKEGQEIKLPPAERHRVTPQDDPEQSSYTCQGVRDVDRPFYSKTSEKRYTKNVLLKRRVLLSISGCIFFGIIAVFIGCIFLRVTRKPADNPEQREESLFLTMAQLKDRADAPCPLASYITEDDLNAPPKEEENGTVCSETTPLPISTDTDQAATTEHHDKDGSNSEMVSFKQ